MSKEIEAIKTYIRRHVWTNGGKDGSAWSKDFKLGVKEGLLQAISILRSIDKSKIKE